MIASRITVRTLEGGCPILKRLEDLPNYRVDEDSPDIRGWRVSDRERTPLGRVDSLILETGEKSPEGLTPVRYMTVKTDRRTVMVPIGLITLHEAKHEVELRASAQDLDRMPDFRPEEATAEREHRYFTTFFPQEKEVNYQRPEFEHRSDRLRRLVEHYRTERTGEQATRPHEETVELRRENVEVERRPVHKPLSETEFATTGGRPIEEGGTIRMPVIGEETVVHKVPYVQEEVVLRTKDQTTRQVVRKQEAEFAASEPTEAERARPRGQTDKPSLAERLREKLDRN